MELSSAVNSTPMPMTMPPEVVRPVRPFTPSLWGDLFSSFSIDDEVWEKYSKEVEVLKIQVRCMLEAAGSGCKYPEKLLLIDTVERLGVSYHFRDEIEHQLDSLFHSPQLHKHDNDDYDLFTTALAFRIFRQHGYKVSCDVFSKFKGSNGKFEEDLAMDARGMLSFYEATHLRINGEEILEEALAFTTYHLKKILAAACSSTCTLMDHDPSSGLAKQVSHALDQPLHKGILRIEAKHFISFYEDDPSKNELLLRFAKLDFNMVHMLHKQELSQLIRWYNELEFASKFPYARNRIVELYFWSVSSHFEPRYALSRMTLAQIEVIQTITDDTYDSYATFDEIQLYTDAIRRWDINSIHKLPDYMKNCYESLLNLVDEIGEEMKKQGRAYTVHYLKESFKEIVEGYYVEAKWLKEKYVPPFHEYLPNALANTGLSMMGITSFMTMGEEASLQDFDYTLHRPKFVDATSLYGRLKDDLVDHEDVNDNSTTAVDCYMKEHEVSKEEAVAALRIKLENAWKDMNEQLLRPTAVSRHLIMIFLNYMRLCFVTYKHDDGYTHPQGHLKNIILQLFVHAIPI